MKTFVTLCCGLLLVSGGALGLSSARVRLFHDLFADYNKEVLPAENTPVSYGLVPVEWELTPTGVLKGSIWERIVYTDGRLKWNPEEYDGLEMLRVPAHLIWVPDITLYNRHNTDQAMIPHLQPGYYSNAVVKNSGEVIIVPETEMEAGCAEADLSDYWGEQTCVLKFGSWTFHEGLINLTIYGGDNMDMSVYRKTSQVQINSFETVRESKKYSCCPENYVNVQYRMKLQRRFRLTDQGIIWNPRLEAVSGATADSNLIEKNEEQDEVKRNAISSEEADE